MKKKLSLLMVALVAIAAFAVQQTRRAAAALIDYPTSKTGITLVEVDGEGVSAGQVSYASISIKGTATDCIKFGKSIKNAENEKYYVELSVEGGFKKGDVISVTGAYTNAASKNAAIVFYDENWTGVWTTENFVNVNDGETEPAAQQFTLTADAAKLYFGRSGNTGTCITSLTITREAEEQGGGDPVDQPTDEGWVKTAPEDLVTGDVVVIVDQAKSVALPNNSGTSSPSQVTVTLNDDKSQIAGDVASTIQWVVTKDGDNYQFNIANTSNYLYVTASNSGVRVGSGERNTFTVKTGGDNNGYYLFNTAKKSDDTDDDRYIGAYSTSDWRCYTSINSNIKGNNNAFYKKTQVPVAVARPTFSVEPGAYTSAQSVELSALPADANIYYTLDGTEPSASSTPYEAAISVTATTTIKAIAINGEDKSKIATAEYTILESIANTKATAYTVSEAYTMIFGDDTTDPATAAKPAEVLAHKDNVVFVKGTVKSVKGVYDSGNATYIITDGTKELTVYNGLYLEGAAFSDVNKANLAVGKEVIVKGNLLKYNTVAELAAGNELISLSFNVTVLSEITNGSVIVDKQTAANGDEVTITATPAEGYALLSCTVTCKTIDQIVEVKDGKFIMPADDVTVSATFVQPEDITIAAADITDGDITAALATATTGKIAKNITINLAENGAYTVSGSIEAGASVKIIGASGAKIDASALKTPFILMSKTPAVAGTTVGSNEVYNVAEISIKDVEITGLPYQLFFANGVRYLVGKLSVDNSIIGINGTAKKTIFDFAGRGCAEEISVNNSTIWANPSNAQNGGLYSSQSGDWAGDLGGAKQILSITNSTLYNIANGKTICTQRQNSKTGMGFVVKNSIIMDCGKSGQFIVGLDGGAYKSAPTWEIENNAFNYGGADVSAAESAKIVEGSGPEDLIKNSIPGIVAFADVAAADFTLTASSLQNKLKIGDPRWLVEFVGYDVKVVNAEGITITPEVTKAAVGEKVYATYTLAEGYELEIPSFVDDNGDEIAFGPNQIGLEEVGGVEKMFIIMPAMNVTIIAKASKKYQIALNLSQENGSATCLSVNAEDPSTSFKKEGKEIYLAITPASNYEAEISVMAGETPVEVIAETGTTKDGQAYTHKFIMPASDVTVTVTFKSTVGINSIAADKIKDATIYTIGGQRVNSAKKGLYIINGKKVVIK